VPTFAIRRTRLEQVLNDHADRRVVLVRGPVGAGKTVLVSQWVTASADPCAWLSIEPVHDDARRLLSQLAEAVGRLTPWGTDGAVTPTWLPDAGATDDSVLRDIIGQASHDLGRKITLVVDDVHRLGDPIARRVLGSLVERPPDATRVVLISRSKPRLGLERARLRGDLVEIPPAALRFERPEVEALVASWADTGRDVAELEQATMGWAAGLRLTQMAAAADHTSVNGSADADAIAGEYVREELLDASPTGLRTFLEVSCWLPAMTEPLCNAVTTLTGAVSPPAWADVEALPVIAVASSPGTYRYPPILARVVQRVLRSHDPERAATARRHAARACRSAQQLPTAIELFLQAGRTDEAAEVCADLAETGEPSLRVVDELLHGLGDATPTGTAWHPWRIRAAVAAGHVDEARHLLEQVDRATATTLDAVPRDSRDMVIARAVLAERTGDPATLLACADRLALLADGAPLDSGADRRTQRWRLRALVWLGDLDGARVAQRALEQRVGETTHEAAIEISLARSWIAWSGGDIAGASDGLALLDGSEPDDGDDGLELALLAGAVRRERGQVATALPLLQRARSRGVTTRHRVVEALAASELARCHLAAGEVMGPLELVVSTRATHPDLPAAVDGRLRGTEVRVRLAQGDADGARAALHDAPPGVDSQLLAVRVALQRAPDEARTLLEAIEASTPRQAVDKLLLQAQLPEIEEADASAALVAAISAGGQLGLVRTFLDEGPSVNRRLQMLALESPDLVLGRLAALVSQELALAPALGASDLVDQLTPRELAVLRMLPLRMSNREMAAQLYISVNTLKTHVRAIYRKLDVTHRSAAVRRAKALQLV
jgi:LuxR family maltose regulon positive regulatory protein